MRFTLVQLALMVLFGTIAFAHESWSQDLLNQQVTLNAQSVEVKKILNEIEKQTTVKFVFSNSTIKAANKISLNVSSEKLATVLSKLLPPLSISYELVGSRILLKKIDTRMGALQEETEPMRTLQTTTDLSSIAFTVSGTVTDEKNEPLVGASVVLEGTSKGVITDLNGKFQLQLEDKDKNGILVFSFVGYEKQNISIDGRAVIAVILKESGVLNAVVVIGYGTQKKKDLTGSIGSVDIEELSKAPVKSFDDALAGRIAGVQITSPDGQPGASPNIVIRGGNSVTQDNSPLYVVDGFPIENYNNNGINPSDIESIEVLKDASSTAIYGARGANGVIIITTKKGKSGRPVVTYNAYFGNQSNTKTMDLMDSYNFVKLQLEVDSAKATAAYLANGKTLDSYKDVPAIDWQKQLFRSAPMQNHNIAIRGGNNDTKYSLSGSFLNQDGTILASNFKRYQGRASIDQRINSKLKVGLIVNYSHLAASGTPTGGNTSLTSGTFQTQNNLLINMWQYRPINQSGNLDELLNNAQDADVISSTNYQWNPVLSAQNQIRNRTTKLFTSNAYLEYSILQGLVLRLSAGINTSNLRYDAFNTSLSVLGSPLSSLGSGGPNGSVTTTDLNNYVNENTLTYTKVFNKDHSLNILGGFTNQRNTSAVNGAGAILVPNDALGVAGLGQGTPFNITSSLSKNTLASFLSRVNYSYKSKYLLTLSFRADGSSKFVGDNKWGYFPSGAAAWHISEEGFLKNNSILSDAKIRASYGIIGNNRVSDFASFGLITQGGSASYAPGNTYIGGAYASSLSNPSLKWESTAERDFGIDLGFLKQRITLTADIYNKKTTDLLLNAQLPTSTGYTTAFQNIGTVENKGVELSLSTVNFKRNKFNWKSAFNIAFNKTNVVALAQNQEFLLSNARWSNTGVGLTPNYIAQIGQPVAMFYGYKWIGNYQISDFDVSSTGAYTLKTGVPNNGFAALLIKPGDIKYQDVNGDGVVNDLDRGTIGNPNPKFIGGFSNSFTLGDFDLNVFFQFVSGNELLNINRLTMEGNISNLYGSNQFASYVNRWSPDNPTNQNYRALGHGPTVYSSRLIEDGSFLRLKTVNIGYRISPSILKTIKIASLRVYASAQNLKTWTNYSGLDPEVSSYNSALTPGADYSAYPRAKVVTFGLDVTF